MSNREIFFVISNFNTDPEQYLEYCSDYIIYDQSSDDSIKTTLERKYNKIKFVENSGHNLTNYFRYFGEHWQDLPDVMMLVKGNMIGRHISLEFFERVSRSRVFTHLYDDRSYKDIPGVSSQLYDGHFLELNTSWYMRSKSFDYFSSFNELLRFIFKSPLIPTWLVFSPGGCFILRKEHVKHYPAEFWNNLRKIVSYRFFPAEAYIVERMLPIIFSGVYELNSWMLNITDFNSELQKVISGHHPCLDRGFSRLRHSFKAKLHRAVGILGSSIKR